MNAWTTDTVILFVLLVAVLWFLLAGCATTEQTRELVDWLLLGVDVGTSILPAVLP